jgi:hypothetical protein
MDCLPQDSATLLHSDQPALSQANFECFRLQGMHGCKVEATDARLGAAYVLAQPPAVASNPPPDSDFRFGCSCANLQKIAMEPRDKRSGPFKWITNKALKYYAFSVYPNEKILFGLCLLLMF